MSAVELVLDQPVARAIGWALIHFVWQGTLIALVAAALLAALRRSAADVRYVVATIALTLMVTMPAVTAVQAWRGLVHAVPFDADVARRFAGASGVATQNPASGPERVDAAAPVNRRATAAADVARVAPSIVLPGLHVEPWLPTLLLAWLCGVALLTLRLASGWLWVQRMKTVGAAPARREWTDMAARLARRLHISRSIRVLESTLVDVPTVIGSLRPVMLLPVSALSGLSTIQLEAILAHELAHIRRHDYLVNLLQTAVETLLFYHPAVWWLSHRIRIERENCCDDLAVNLCGDPYTYASALADLEELRGGQLVIAANGGSLLQRVRRLLGAPSHEGRAPGWLAGGLAVLVIMTIAAGTIGNEVLRGHAVQPEAPQAAAAPAAPVEPPAPPSLEAPRAIAAVARVAEAAVPAAPAVAFAPAAPAPAAAAPVSPEQSGRRDSGRRPRGNYTWSNDGERLSVEYDGEIEFTDDDTDVRWITPGGYLKISDGGWIGGRGVNFKADANGNVTRQFRVGIVEKPFEPEGRAWLARTLPRFIRQSGLGAPARVSRILKAKGPAGVLAEISLIEGSYGKRVYFGELLKTPLEPAVVRQVLSQAGREIAGDYELASLLISVRHLLVDEGARRAYFEAANSIQGDYEMRRVLSEGLKSGQMSSAILASILTAAASIQGDYEQASLLVDIAKSQPLDSTNRRAFFAALDGVAGAYERGRVLNTLADRQDLTQDMLVSMVQSIGAIRSDYEQAQFLTKVAKHRPIDATLRTPFFTVVDTLSPYERGQVLKAVARRADTPAETIVAVIRSAGAMNSHYESSQVLQAVAAVHTIGGTARDAYLDAAEKLGEYEQGRALSALMKSERTKR